MFGSFVGAVPGDTQLVPGVLVGLAVAELDSSRDLAFTFLMATPFLSHSHTGRAGRGFPARTCNTGLFPD